jgi:hypothetical protein
VVELCSLILLFQQPGLFLGLRVREVWPPLIFLSSVGSLPRFSFLGCKSCCYRFLPRIFFCSLLVSSACSLYSTVPLDLSSHRFFGSHRFFVFRLGLRSWIVFVLASIFPRGTAVARLHFLRVEFLEPDLCSVRFHWSEPRQLFFWFSISLP